MQEQQIVLIKHDTIAIEIVSNGSSKISFVSLLRKKLFESKVFESKIFFRRFSLVLTQSSFWEEDWAQGYNSMMI